jgi:outer membrane protein OmpA-like peptidoglycan-associated protein
MNTKHMRAVAATVVVLLFSLSGFAQYHDATNRQKSASLEGTTGLFKAWDAETLKAGEINFTIGFDRFNRNPGQLTIGNLKTGFAVGIMDRLEFFAVYDVQRFVDAYNIETYRVAPGSLPRPATTPPPSPNPNQYFGQVAPFMDVPYTEGPGDFRFGLKFNMLSERRGSPFSLALAGFGTIPSSMDETAKLNRGLTNGSAQGGFNALVSKTIRNITRFHINLGANYYTDPEIGDVKLADLQQEVIYKLGAEFPAYGNYRFIAEMAGFKYFDHGSEGLNPKSPLEVILGMRVYPKEWFSLGAGYQASFNHVDYKGAGYNGFVVQGAFGTRRNSVPEVSCAVVKKEILQDDKVAIRANATDGDRDNLTFTWSATGGKVTGAGDTAEFDATGVAPGTYTITGTASDGKDEGSCSTEITVLKRNVAPTVVVEPTSTTITQGETASLRAIASDANNDPLTYSWTVNGERLAADSPQISFGSEGREPGDYNVTVTVSDGEATASATSVVTVRERVIPNVPPVINCLTTTIDVASGQTTELRTSASDPDGDPITVNWSSTGGSVRGTGQTATFDASGTRAGSYTVTATVDDGRGGKASCTMTVNVSERLSVTKEDCGYFAYNRSRVDNCAKAVLDDLAVRMRNEPRLRANIIGFTDGRYERPQSGLGERRAKAVASYLEKQGVDASRMTITNGGDSKLVGDIKNSAGRRLNRRVEIDLTVR